VIFVEFDNKLLNALFVISDEKFGKLLKVLVLFSAVVLKLLLQAMHLINLIS